MKEEDKQLLLVDLCSRLPYGVNVKTTGDNESYTLLSINTNKNFALIGLNFSDVYATSKIKIDEVKPYLRPMSSMTKEEWDDYHKVGEMPHNIIDWFNKRHFDYRHLIEKGLALEAPEEMYKVEEE